MIRDTIDGFWMNVLNLRTRLQSELEGATAVEYGLMVALIAAVIIAAVVLVGRETSEAFGCTGDSLVAKTNKC